MTDQKINKESGKWKPIVSPGSFGHYFEMYASEQKINKAIAKKQGWIRHRKTCKHQTVVAYYCTYGPHWFHPLAGCFKSTPNYCGDILATGILLEWVRTQDLNIKKMFMANLTSRRATYFVEGVLYDPLSNPLSWFIFKADWPMEICLAYLRLK